MLPVLSVLLPYPGAGLEDSGIPWVQDSVLKETPPPTTTTTQKPGKAAILDLDGQVPDPALPLTQHLPQ